MAVSCGKKELMEGIEMRWWGEVSERQLREILVGSRWGYS